MTRRIAGYLCADSARVEDVYEAARALRALSVWELCGEGASDLSSILCVGVGPTQRCATQTEILAYRRAEKALTIARGWRP